MKHKLLTSAFAAGLLASLGALAATQGELSATSSTGTFVINANGPATVRMVQVLGLTDITLNNTTFNELGSSNPGATMAFCVVDTYGAAVTLTASSSNALFAPSQWSLATSGGGERVGYYSRLTLSDLTNLNDNQNAPNSTTFGATIAAGRTVTLPSSCPSAANVKFHLTLAAPMPETLPARTYSDTITMVVTPQ